MRQMGACIHCAFLCAAEPALDFLRICREENFFGKITVSSYRFRN